MNYNFSIEYEKEKRRYLIQYNHNRNIVLLSISVFILLSGTNPSYIIACVIYWFFSYLFHIHYIKTIDETIEYLENQKRLDDINP